MMSVPVSTGNFILLPLKVQGRLYRCSIPRYLVGKFKDQSFLNLLGRRLIDSNLPYADQEMGSMDVYIIHVTAQNGDLQLYCPSAPKESSSEIGIIEVHSPPRKKHSGHVRPDKKHFASLQKPSTDICRQFGDLSPFKSKIKSFSNRHFPQEDSGTDDGIGLLPKTNCIQVKNLDDDFVKEHFIRTITKFCRARNLVGSNDAAVLDCSDMDVTTSLVLLKLTSCELAEKVVSWSPFQYEIDGDCALIFYLHYPDDNECVSQEKTKFLKVSGLEADFIKKHFIKSIFKACVSKGLISETGIAVVHCSDFDNSSEAVILELVTCELAEMIISWTPYVYDFDNVLKFERHYPCDVDIILDSGRDSVKDERENVFHKRTEDITCSLETPSMAVAQDSTIGNAIPTVPSTGEPTSPFQNDENTEAFLVECLKAKGSAPKFVGSTQKYQTVVSALAKFHRVVVSVEQCKNKMKRLQEHYRRNPRTFKWGTLVAQLRGKVDGTSDDSTASASRADLLKLYTFGDFKWDEKNTRCFISIMVDLKDEFVGPHRDAMFWRKVSDQMADQQLFADPKQCQNRMNVLQAMYKDVETRRKQTGAGAVKCPFYEDLHPLLADSVTVEPMLTYCAGGVRQTSANPALEGFLPNRPRTGRERMPATLSKETSSKGALSREEQVALVDSLNKSREKLMETLAQVARQHKK